MDPIAYLKNKFSDRTFKAVAFNDIGINQTFVTFDMSGTSLGYDVWCNKIDDSRYILVGQNGALYPDEKNQGYFVEL